IDIPQITVPGFSLQAQMEIEYPKYLFTFLGFLPAKRFSCFSPDHPFNNSITVERICIPAVNNSTVPHHHNLIRNFKQFFQFMRDKDHCPALLLVLSDDLEEHINFLVRKS